MHVLILLLLLADPLPGTQPDGVACVLVRDARTGRPLPGVRVTHHLEDASDSFLKPELLAETKTDAHGIARIKWKGEPGDSHWTFDKAGFAVESEYGPYPPDVVDLKPGRRIRARVRGPFGVPRAGVSVEALLGCSHSPAVRRAVTDKDGWFTLVDVDPRGARLWFVAPDLGAAYEDAVSGDIYAGPGRLVEGRVVDEKGNGIARAVVGSQQEMRGPRVLTAPDGRFRFPGFIRGEGIIVCGPDGRVAYVDGDGVDTDGTFTIVARRRAAANIAGRPDPDARDVEIEFAFVDETTGEPVNINASLLRKEDGWVFELDSDDRISAPPGRYVLRIGRVFDSHAAAPRPFEVTLGDTKLRRIKVRRQAELVLDHGVLPPNSRMVVMTARDEAVNPSWIRPDVKAALRVTAEGMVRVFPVGPVEDGKRTVVIEWPDPREIVVDVPYSWRLEHVWFERRGKVLLTHAVGAVELLVSDEHLGTQHVRMGAAGVTVADLRVPGSVEVTLPGGVPLKGGRALVRDGRRVHKLDLARGRSWCLRDGASVRVERDGLMPLRRVLEGPGPYHLQWGAGALELSVKGQKKIVVIVDGERFQRDDGRLRLGGLDEGPHTILVGAPGRETQILTLAWTGTKTIELALK